MSTTVWWNWRLCLWSWYNDGKTRSGHWRYTHEEGLWKQFINRLWMDANETHIVLDLGIDGRTLTRTVEWISSNGGHRNGWGGNTMNSVDYFCNCRNYSALWSINLPCVHIHLIHLGLPLILLHIFHLYCNSTTLRPNCYHGYDNQ